MINPTILKLIQAERNYQDDKWGVQHHSEVEWISILGEEYGEACQQANRVYFGKVEPIGYAGELIETIAVAVEMLEAIKPEVLEELLKGYRVWAKSPEKPLQKQVDWMTTQLDEGHYD